MFPKDFEVKFPEEFDTKTELMLCLVHGLDDLEKYIECALGTCGGIDGLLEIVEEDFPDLLHGLHDIFESVSATRDKLVGAELCMPKQVP